jgi:membrane-associated protein
MIDIVSLLSWGGLLVVGALVFAESGLLIGLFLPGDSLVFTAGILAADGVFDVRALIVVVIIATVAGDQLGYLLGKRFGNTLLRRVPAVYTRRAKRFFTRFGWFAVAGARFLPIVRTIIPFLAGASRYPLRRFAIANLAGGVLWATTFCLAGYWLGASIPNIRSVVIVIALIGVSAAILVGLVRYRLLKRPMSERSGGKYRRKP